MLIIHWTLVYDYTSQQANIYSSCVHVLSTVSLSSTILPSPTIQTSQSSLLLTIKSLTSIQTSSPNQPTLSSITHLLSTVQPFLSSRSLLPLPIQLINYSTNIIFIINQFIDSSTTYLSYSSII